MTDLLTELAKSKADGAHSIFSPSSAAMWSWCPGSLVPNALAHDSAGKDAAEGTVAHALADQWLRNGTRPPLQTVVEDGYTIVVDDAMLAYVEQYVDWVQDCRGNMYFEQRVDFSQVTPIPGQTGTADHFSCTFGELTITDLKYGKGVRVDIEYDGELNPQLMLYALGVFFEWDWYYGFQKINLRICQPRLDHMPSVTINRERLLAFAEWIKERASDAWRLDAPRRPSPKACQWCKVQKTCPAYLTWFEALVDAQADDVFGVPAMREAAAKADDVFDDEPVLDLPEMSVTAWCRVLKMRKAVEAWFAEGERIVFQAALDGEAPGWKVVEGRSNRTWVDEDDARARMVEVGIPLDETDSRKILSPNQAEELLHAKTKMPKRAASKLFESQTTRSDGIRSLVQSSDKREALPDYGSYFD